MRKTVFAILVLYITAVYAFAETSPDMEEVFFMEIPSVITPTMTQKTGDTAPASVTVITEREIKESGARSLPEALERLTGIHVFDSYDARALTNIRGVLTEVNDKIKLLIDGHSYFEPVWNNSFDFYIPPMENIKQIEVVRGPGSALYGTGAFIATVNIITKKPKDVYGLTVEQAYGSFNTWTTNAAYGTKQGAVELGFNVNSYQTNGPEMRIEHDWLSGQSAMGTSLAPRSTTEQRRRRQADMYVSCGNFSVSGMYANNELSMPLAEIATFTEDGQKMLFDYGYGEVKYEVPFSDSFKARMRVSYDNIRFNMKGQVLPLGFNIAGGMDLNGDGISEIWPDGVRSDYRYTSDQYKTEVIFDHSITGTNELLLGMFYEDIRVRDPQFKTNMDLATMLNTGGYIDYTGTSGNFLQPCERAVSGAFFQDEWNVTKEWYLILGGRYDKYSDVGESFSPRSGIVWKYSSDLSAGSIKCLYGSAFRAPSISQLYMLAVGNTKLKPETMDSLELIITDTMREKLATQVSVYGYVTKDQTIRSSINTGGVVQWVNLNRTKAWGCEVMEKYYIQSHTFIYAGYSHIDAKDDVTNGDLPFTAKDQAQAGCNLQLGRYVNVKVNADYSSAISREEGDTRPPVGEDIITDMTIGVENYAKCDFYLSIYNIFDRKVFAPSFLALLPLDDLPRPGIQYACGLTYRF